MLLEALQKVFQKPKYLLLAFGTSLVMFAFAVWLLNIPLIIKVMGHSEISFRDKFDLPVSLLGGIVTNFTLLSASSTILIAVLFGVNVAMIVFFLKRIGSFLSHTTHSF